MEVIGFIVFIGTVACLIFGAIYSVAVWLSFRGRSTTASLWMLVVSTGLSILAIDFLAFASYWLMLATAPVAGLAIVAASRRRSGSKISGTPSHPNYYQRPIVCERSDCDHKIQTANRGGHRCL